MERVNELIIKEIESLKFGTDKMAGTEAAYNEALKASVLIVKKHSKQPTLNENQQIVLETLKIFVTDNYTKPIGPIGGLFASVAILADAELTVDNRTSKAYVALNTYQEAQVLQAFATWVLEQEEDL